MKALDLSDNPLTKRMDMFMSGAGYRKMAARVLVLSLDELTCDPSTGRSGPEREEMARLKEEAVPWFNSPSFEAFALAFAPVETIDAFRRACLGRPDAVRKELQHWLEAHDSRGTLDGSFEWTRGAPANCWPFSGMATQGLGAPRPLVPTLGAAPALSEVAA